MSQTIKQPLRSACVEDDRLRPPDLRLVQGVLEIECTNPFDVIDISYTCRDGEVDQVLVVVCDADGGIIKDDAFDINLVDWIVIDAPAGDEPIVNHTLLNLNNDGNLDPAASAPGMQFGLSVRSRSSLSPQRR